MSDDYSGIEKLLGLPAGSTKQTSPAKATELLAKGVKQKTNELDKEAKKVDTLEKLPSSELVKSGISLETLEADKVTIRNEAFEVYNIAKALLIRFKSDTDDLVDVNDRMVASLAKMVDSVTGSLDKLSNMNIKFRQEEEMKGLSMLGQEDDGTKEMSTEDWNNFVDSVKDEDDEDDDIAQDAEIIDDET